jgi:ADP-dependent phosphofructokinase/glucokinase
VHLELGAVSDDEHLNDTLTLLMPWVSSLALDEQGLEAARNFQKGLGAKKVFEAATGAPPSVGQISARLARLLLAGEEAEEAEGEKGWSAKAAGMLAGQQHRADGGGELDMSRLSRVHVHTETFTVLCQRPGRGWGDAKPALAAAALAAQAHTCGGRGGGAAAAAAAAAATVAMPRSFTVRLDNR